MISFITLEETGLVHDEDRIRMAVMHHMCKSERMKTGIYMKYAKRISRKGPSILLFLR